MKLPLWGNCNSYDELVTVCNHARDKLIRLSLHSRPILLLTRIGLHSVLLP